MPKAKLAYETFHFDIKTVTCSAQVDMLYACHLRAFGDVLMLSSVMLSSVMLSSVMLSSVTLL